ncbi:MAG: CHAT domain-containing protein [Blastocatellia bacterium]|nr:CHAT domain-containing protein [Blastocatellia bacterium]
MASQTEFQPSSRFRANSRSAKFTPRNKYLPDSFRERAGGIALCIILLILPGPLATMRAKAFTAHYGGVSINSLQSAQDTRKLSPDKPVERELAAGEIHHYQITVAAGQFLHVSLDRRGLNLYMALFTPEGKKLFEVNRAPYPGNLIPILYVAEASGNYRLEVSLRVGDKGPGRYKVSVEELRTATDRERSQVLAEWTYVEGQHLFEEGTAQSMRESIEKLEEAVSLYTALGNRRSEALALGFIGLNYFKLEEKQKAIDCYARALALFRDIGDHNLEAIMLNNIRMAYLNMSDFRKAIDYFNEALPVLRAEGNRGSEATTLNNIGVAYYRLNEYRKAADYLNQTLPLYRAIGYRRGEALSLHNIGQSYSLIGEWQKALEYFDQALPVARAIENRQMEANLLLAIGGVYSSLSEHKKELDYYNRALPVFREIGDRRAEANVLARLGRMSRLSGEIQKAFDQFNQSLSINRSITNRLGEAVVLRDIARLHEVLGEKQKAIEYLNQALPILSDIGSRGVEAAVLNDLGEVYASLGEYQKALDYSNRALEIYRGTGYRIGEAQALYSIARIHRGEGNLIAARTHSDAALRLVEAQRSKVASPEARASYFASVQNYYDLNIDLLMQLHKQSSSERFDSVALETNERARARSLLELLAEARADIRQGVDPELLDREQSLGELLNVKSVRQTQLLSGKHTPEQASAATKEIESLLTEYQQVQARIRATSPRYAALTQPQPASLKDIQQQVLDRDTLLLEYALSRERSYVWAVSKDSIASFELPGREEIEAAARRFYELLRRGDSGRGEFEEAAAALSRMLLAPVADRLGTKRLVIVADGVLHYIPFAALPLPETQKRGDTEMRGDNILRVPASPTRSRVNRPLVAYMPLFAEHEIVTLPSASVLAEMRRDLAERKPAQGAVAVFADPVFSRNDSRLRPGRRERETDEPILGVDLQRAMRDVGVDGERFPRLLFSRREARAITGTVASGKAMNALDFQASRATVEGADLSNYRVIHFATHGLINNQHPELSGIVLSLVDRDGNPQDGFLRLHEIYNMKLSADLAVLSACETALGKEIRGEGLVGLTRGFMYAGASRVVASLWKVDDAATADFMKRFYTGMFVKKLRPAAALREAQVEMWKQERWRSPYYWAAFVLQGEWR